MTISKLREGFSTDKVWNKYELDPMFLDEVFNSDSSIRQHYIKTLNQFKNLSIEDIQELNEYTRLSFFKQGITFHVYGGDHNGVERIFPFDPFPRILNNKEWNKVETGAIQRTQAINAFLKDIYTDQKILKDKVIPKDFILGSPAYCKHMVDFVPTAGVYTHISGTDLIKDDKGDFFVLEDNVRCPSGVSYVLSNRASMKRIFPDLFGRYKVQAVDDYSQQLLSSLQSVAPEGNDEPNVVVLTPGMYNSAYFEHTFLASQMGVELVEGSDLFVENGFVYMKTIYGPERVDVIYRRVDDDFLDPLYFKKDSMLGVPGILDAYKAGNVTIANAPGTGIADDKAVYTYMPEIIKYYLDEEPILNNVKTYKCEKSDECQFVMENMENLVVKPVDESGGYGVMVGSKATKKEISDYKALLKKNPRKYIAQPIMPLSVHTTYIEDEKSFEQRHVDLRTFTLAGKDSFYVCKGGLTRVALKKGSLIVNSSQGGGSKDTWVLEQ